MEIINLGRPSANNTLQRSIIETLIYQRMVLLRLSGMGVGVVLDCVVPWNPDIAKTIPRQIADPFNDVALDTPTADFAVLVLQRKMAKVGVFLDKNLSHICRRVHKSASVVVHQNQVRL